VNDEVANKQIVVNSNGHSGQYRHLQHILLGCEPSEFVIFLKGQTFVEYSIMKAINVFKLTHSLP